MAYCHGKISKSLKTPTNTHSPSSSTSLNQASQGYHFSGKKKIEVRSLARLPVTPSNLCLADRPPELPSVMSCVVPASPVLNPKLCGTFSWPTNKSPFTSFFSTWSLLHSCNLLREGSAWLLHLAVLLPKCLVKGAPFLPPNPCG